jgi:shikimate dehydrogenase
VDAIELSGTTRVVALIGSPARHSLSPAIVNAGFAELGLDWAYVVFEVEPGRGADALAAVRTLGISGLSVTMPHKAAACAAVDELTPVAEALGAVNCVSWSGDRLVGDSTDGPGFVDSLRHEGIEVAGRSCAVVGAGGAGRAVVRALAQAGAREVVVVNRSPEPAAQAVALAGAIGRLGTHDDLADADIVVNATSLGMAGTGVGAAELPFAVDRLGRHAVVADLIYHPLDTPLLTEARRRGLTTVTGLGMLVHQAAHAFRRWTGHEAPVEVMAKAAEEALARGI